MPEKKGAISQHAKKVLACCEMAPFFSGMPFPHSGMPQNGTFFFRHAMMGFEHAEVHGKKNLLLVL